MVDLRVEGIWDWWSTAAGRKSGGRSALLGFGFGWRKKKRGAGKKGAGLPSRGPAQDQAGVRRRRGGFMVGFGAGEEDVEGGGDGYCRRIATHGLRLKRCLVVHFADEDGRTADMDASGDQNR